MNLCLIQYDHFKKIIKHNLNEIEGQWESERDFESENEGLGPRSVKHFFKITNNSNQFFPIIVRVP